MNYGVNNNDAKKTCRSITIVGLVLTTIFPALVQASDQKESDTYYTSEELIRVVDSFENLANQKDIHVTPEYGLFFLSGIEISQIPKVPQSFVDNVRLGVEKFEQGNYPDAQDAFIIAQKQYPSTVFPNYFLSLVFIKLKEFRKAERVLLDVLRSRPDCVEASAVLRRIKQLK